MEFAYPQLGYLLFVPPLLWLIANALYNRKQTQLARQLHPQQLAALLRGPAAWRIRGAMLCGLLGLGGLILALMRPLGPPQPELVKKTNRDLVFLLDVSKSMLAEDLRPNRLERAKQMLLQLTQNLEGERVALVIFAGQVKIQSPLTLDYAYFQNLLLEATPDEIPQGGTQLGEAIRFSLDRLFYDPNALHKDLIILTDGEDHQSNPLQAAAQAKAAGVRIHVVGLGSLTGSTIPNGLGGVITHEGKPVLSALREGQLQQIADLTGGHYLPVRTRLADLSELYQQLIRPLPPTQAASKNTMVRQEWFLYPLGFALCCFLIESLLLAEPKAGKISLTKPGKMPTLSPTTDQTKGNS